ncbi:hypothetical protein [Sphingobium xenophagum]|uniref:hypothetical protein n=1 Tax=Sphingobium xenophagum TaxID=121428 RepID=UPI0003686ABF|nr:hypothetical protein [Sphingobium xenophagum]
MADVEKLIGRATLAVPVLHVLTCGIYIAGYSAGFGGNIGGMFSASDFFTITIQHLIMIYVLGLIFPTGFILLRHRAGKTYAADEIEREENPTRKTRLISDRKFIVGFMDWFLPSVGLVMIAMLFCQFWTGARIEYYMTFNMILLALMPTWWRLASYFRFYGLPAEITWCVFVFIIGVLGVGLNAGDKDRRAPYMFLANGHMRCKEQVILNPIGDRFISVTADNRRHIVADDCNVRFDFEAAPTFAEGSLYDLVSAKLFPSP